MFFLSPRLLHQDGCRGARRSRAFSTPHGRREKPRLSALQISLAGQGTRRRSKTGFPPRQFSGGIAKHKCILGCRERQPGLCALPCNGGQITPKAREGSSHVLRERPTREGNIRDRSTSPPRQGILQSDCPSPRLFKTHPTFGLPMGSYLSSLALAAFTR